jgi:hypothetical protein
MIPFDYLLMIILAFLFGIVDASFGMGYGTMLTPVLLMLGLAPFQVVPAVLVSQLAGDFLAVMFHHRFENVNLSIGSRDFKIALILAALSLTGSVIAVLVAFNIPLSYLNLYIGASVSASGLIILATRKKSRCFSWLRLFFLGSFAAFNKGISGGGYGPIAMAGQILTGVEVKSAIGITALSEGITCIFAAATYFLIYRSIDLPLLVLLSIGITFSAPLAALIVRKVESRNIKLMIGTLTLMLGLLTVLKALLV